MSVGAEWYALSPGGFDAEGNDDVPALRLQYAEKKACADAMSAVCDEHACPTCELIDWLTTSEFWFFWHTQVARLAASGGHSSYVMPMTAYATWLDAHGARYDISGMSVMYRETGMVGVGKVARAIWLQ